MTHRPGLGHSERLQLVAALRAAGLSVAGYIPDASLLAVGPPAAADVAAALPGVLWVVSSCARVFRPICGQLRALLPVCAARLAAGLAGTAALIYCGQSSSGPVSRAPVQGLHAPEYKVAPEWEPILSALPSLPAGPVPANATAAARAAYARLGCLVDWGSGARPRLGVQVSMPRQEEDWPGGDGGVLRAGRLLQMEQRRPRRQHVGEAAVEDWAAPLAGLCSSGSSSSSGSSILSSSGEGASGVEVRPAGPSAALVLVPPRCLQVRRVFCFV